MDLFLCLLPHVTCVGFPPAPELALCVTGLVCTCFGSSGLPFASLCALASAPVCALCVAGCMCMCFISPPCPLCHECYVFFWLCQEGCVHLSRFVFLLSVGARVPLCTSCVCLPRHTRPPGPALCAARAVPWLGLHDAPPLVPHACLLFGATVNELPTG